MFKNEFRFALRQGNNLRVLIRVLLTLQLVDECNARRFFLDFPRAAVQYFIRSAEAVAGLVWFFEDAYADSEKTFTAFCFIVTDGVKRINWPHNGVVQGRFITIEPFPEIMVVVIFEVIDYTAPVESGTTVIAVDCVGQIELGIDQSVGDRKSVV